MFKNIAFTVTLALALITYRPITLMAQQNMPTFSPTSGWQVQPAVTSDGTRLPPNIVLPCMAKAVYNNGFELRMSGANKQLMAMAVNVKQPAFTRGRQYNAAITITGGRSIPLTATAFADNIVIINLRETPALYQQLPESARFDLTIDNNQFRFDTGALSNAIAQLEQCYQGKPTDNQQSFKSVEPPAPIEPFLHSAPVPKVEQDIDWEPIKTRPSTPAIANPPNMTWTAQQGALVQEILQRWGAQEGVRIDWRAETQSGFAPTLRQDFRFHGSFEQAVTQLLTQNGSAYDLHAEIYPDRNNTTPKALSPKNLSMNRR